MPLVQRHAEVLNLSANQKLEGFLLITPCKLIIMASFQLMANSSLYTRSFIVINISCIT